MTHGRIVIDLDAFPLPLVLGPLLQLVPHQVRRVRPKTQHGDTVPDREEVRLRVVVAEVLALVEGAEHAGCGVGERGPDGEIVGPELVVACGQLEQLVPNCGQGR